MEIIIYSIILIVTILIAYFYGRFKASSRNDGSGNYQRVIEQLELERTRIERERAELKQEREQLESEKTGIRKERDLIERDRRLIEELKRRMGD